MPLIVGCHPVDESIHKYPSVCARNSFSALVDRNCYIRRPHSSRYIERYTCLVLTAMGKRDERKILGTESPSVDLAST